MDQSKLWYSCCVACLGLACFTISAIAVGIPYWGYFSSTTQSGDFGHFGPWIICRQNIYNSETCGQRVSAFSTVPATFIAGIFAAVGVTSLGIFFCFCILQLTVIMSRERTCMKYSHLMITKLVLAVASSLLTISAAGIFAIQTDDLVHGYDVTRGISFYLQISVVVCTFLLLLMTAYEYIFSKRVGGDPTEFEEGVDGTSNSVKNSGFIGMPLDTNNQQHHDNGKHGQKTAYKNKKKPLFRNGSSQLVSMTPSSGKPYANSKTNGYSYVNGSIGSVTSEGTVTSLNSTGSGRTPLRSSLKKPHPKTDNNDGASNGADSVGGIQNPGFSATSPSLTRNGSIKKVRIQTQSTEV